MGDVCRLTRAVLFDFWDTIVFSERQEGEKLRHFRTSSLTNALLDTGFTVSSETVERAMDKVNKECNKIRKTGREVDLHSQVRMLMALLGIEDQNHGLSQKLWDVYANAVFSIELRVRDGAATVLRSLRDNGYRTGLICNTYHSPGSVLRKIIQSFGLSRCFDVLMFSDEYGMPKPMPEIFIEVLTRLGIKPEEAAHVGDRPDLDVVGAKNAGVKAIYLKISNNEYPPDLPKPDAIIETLWQIPKVIATLR